ncbi:Alpha/Beta hydrolase protein [Leptodontidium sp. 2 PMI_412]|nr:Alpha/Beta hydrolase protein [Leptodontidium sp. 2 PMI_412]
MSTYETVPTQYASVDGLKLAYRRFGTHSLVPLVYLPHFRASMDVTDPIFFNYVARSREVILIDNAGIGHSEGSVQETLQEMAATVAKLLTTIGVTKADFLGFSLGGMVAQCIGFGHPQLVRKLVLAGTQPAQGEGVAFAGPEILEGAGSGGQPTVDAFLFLFFHPSEASAAKGRAWYGRLGANRNVEDEKIMGFLDGPGTTAQQVALGKYVSDPENYNKLASITAPVLVTNGHTDVMCPTVNSFVMQQAIQDAELHLFPDSGHGHLFQFPEAYTSQLELFLSK